MPKIWIARDQIRRSLEDLKTLHPFFGMAFLAFKIRKIPAGDVKKIGFAALMREFLTQYYKPSLNYSGYYNPFKTSDPSNRWVTEKYPSGALQRITVDTFSGAILHDKNTPFWGWKEDYVEALSQLRSQTKSSIIPTFHLAIWLFRDEELPEGAEPSTLIEQFIQKFGITDEESQLFNHSIPKHSELVSGWISKDRVSQDDLLNIIGWPPGEVERGAVKLEFLELRSVGPTKRLRYEPNNRINILTGDNSLGKTFLLECMRWSQKIGQVAKVYSTG